MHVSVILAISYHLLKKNHSIIAITEKLKWIVLEYLPNGDLKTFLTVNTYSLHGINMRLVNVFLACILQENSRPIETLMKYMYDIAQGMLYLAEKGFIHRVYVTSIF